jgi:hypothetical protein
MWSRSPSAVAPRFGRRRSSSCPTPLVGPGEMQSAYRAGYDNTARRFRQLPIPEARPTTTARLKPPPIMMAADAAEPPRMLRPEGTADGFRPRSVLIRRAGMCAHIESAGSGHPTPAAGISSAPDAGRLLSNGQGEVRRGRSRTLLSCARGPRADACLQRKRRSPRAPSIRDWSWDAGITNAVVGPPGVGSEPEVSRLTR